MIMASHAPDTRQIEGDNPCAPVVDDPAASAQGDSQPTGPSSNEATFRLCGTPDPETEQTIAQLIAGRSYGTTLRAGRDGCADLTITLAPGSVMPGRQTTNQTVSTGSGARISVQIASENGQTRVTLAGSR